MGKLKTGFLSSLIIIILAIGGCEQKKSAEIKSGNNSPRIAFGIVNYKSGMFYAAGWAADQEDGAPVQKVVFYIDDKAVGTAELGFERKDVAEHFKNNNWLKSGWIFKGKIMLEKGPHRFYAIAHDRVGATAKSNEKVVDIQ